MPLRGTKRTCTSCDARFYDLGRPEPTCPKCGAAFVEVARVYPQRLARRSRVSFSRTGPKPATVPVQDDAPVMDVSAAEDAPETDEDENEDADAAEESDDEDRAAEETDRAD